MSTEIRPLGSDNSELLERNKKLEKELKKKEKEIENFRVQMMVYKKYEEEIGQAIKDNTVTLPRLERAPIDPPIVGQVYSIVSFRPIKFLCPKCNEEFEPPKKVYGLFKIRGTFSNNDDMKKKYREIIRSVDSRYKLGCCHVGYWNVLTPNMEEFAQEVEEVDLNPKKRDPTTESGYMSHLKETQEIKERDRQVKKDIDDREQDLLDSVKEDIDINSIDYYIEQRVKKGTQLFMIEQCDGKKKEASRALKKTNKEIYRLENAYPEYDKLYKKKYYDARRKVGISDNAPDPTCLIKSKPQFPERVPIEVMHKEQEENARKRRETTPAQTQIEQESVQQVLKEKDDQEEEAPNNIQKEE
jgi:hypothetical protein